ncbi:MAG: hypothetical protein WC477_00025 [Patescibacteria group bacterium]
MNKKTLTIVIVVVGLAVIGGAAYGYQRWRQQQLANQILRGIYGTNVPSGLLGGTVSNQVAQEIAKEAAKQKLDEAKEAAKTPEDLYNETAEMPTYDANSATMAAEAKVFVEKVFGKAKLTSISTGMYGGTMNGSGNMEFKIARLTTGADLAALSKALTDAGMPVVQSGISDQSASLSAGSYETAMYSYSFSVGDQEVDVDIIKNTQ